MSVHALNKKYQIIFLKHIAKRFFQKTKNVKRKKIQNQV